MTMENAVTTSEELTDFLASAEEEVQPFDWRAPAAITAGLIVFASFVVWNLAAVPVSSFFADLTQRVLESL